MVLALKRAESEDDMKMVQVFLTREDIRPHVIGKKYVAHMKMKCKAWGFKVTQKKYKDGCIYLVITSNHANLAEEFKNKVNLKRFLKDASIDGDKVAI